MYNIILIQQTAKKKKKKQKKTVFGFRRPKWLYQLSARSIGEKKIFHELDIHHV